ncbi:pre-peptidase C-terminal domain-containing protein [Rosettibacter firmus]|uniref:pre-peptidase C-terminal domain-containing protein n=1 Tax=Rosettibacter firmus TaxID=3111522 RepID=UPI00336BFD22
MKNILTIILSVILCINVFAESEPNNTHQQATPITPNSSDNGTLFYNDSQNYDDVDWWVITLSYDGSLYFEVNSTGNLDIDLYIYDVDGETSIASYDISIGQRESTHHNALKAGTYYVKAVRYSGSGSYTIFNRFTLAPYQNDSEPDDSFEQALPLALNSESTGHIGYYQAKSYDQVDWWKVVIPFDGSLKIRTESDSADIDLYIYDVDGKTSIASYDISIGLIEETHFNNLIPGTYFIKVVLYSKHGGYKITSNYVQTNIENVTTNDAETNDSYDKAQSLGVFNATSTVVNYGHLGYYSNSYTDDVDWWSVDVQTDGKLIIKTLSNETLEIDLYLYDVDGITQIASYDISTGINEQTHFNGLSPGKYFIKAFKYSGYGSYKIVGEFIKSKLENDIEPNNDMANALQINSNIVYTGHLGYYSKGITDNSDYYKITLTSNWDSLYVRTDSDSTLEIDLYLYDNLQNQISYAGLYGVSEIMSLKNANANTYYIRAYKYSGYGSYAIKVTNRYPGNPLTDIVDEDVKTITATFALNQNYPNPFNPVTIISYQIPENSFVTLKVYDILGNEVATLVNELQIAGVYKVEFSANHFNLSSGIYFYKLEAGTKFSQVKKFILMK